MRLLGIITILFLISALAVQGLVYQPAWPVHTCAISTGHGLLQDFDCDKVPDYEDNCFEIPNPYQQDTNKDGVGDACADLYGLEAGKESAEESRPKTITSSIEGKIKVIEAQDIQLGGPGAVYPIKLSNTGNYAERFELELTGLTFGTYRIDPSSTMVLGPGEDKTAYLHILADDDAEEGQYNFNLRVTADGETEETELTASVIDVEDDEGKNRLGVILGWIVVVLVAIILAVILIRELGRRGNGNHKKREKDIYSYY